MSETAGVIVRVIGFNIAIGGEAIDLGRVVEAIRRSGADIAGLQECEGNAPAIAALLGWAHVDERHQVVSRWPVVEPHDADGHHLLVHLAPDRVLAFANVHLPSDPYGPYAHRDGMADDDVIALERGTRLRALEPHLATWATATTAGVPLVVTGDFNAPSHRDWGPGAAEHRSRPLPWPVSTAMESAGFVDAYRSANPVGTGLTWTTGFPHPQRSEHEMSDRIDFVWCTPDVAVLEVALVGPSGADDVSIEVDPWPSDHLAVLATFEVEPVRPPPYVAVLSRRVESGDTIAVRWCLDEESADDRILLRRPKSMSGSAPVTMGWLAPRETGRTGLVRFGTGDLEIGEHEVVLEAAGTEIGAVGVHVVPRGAPPRITANRDGRDLVVEWDRAPGRKFDWVGVFRLGDPDLEHGAFATSHTGARVCGSWTLHDAPDGPLTVRLFHDDSYAVAAAVEVA